MDPAVERIDHKPIFIVGCQRSGTTLLRLILDAHPNLSIGPESRFLDDLAKVTGEDWPRIEPYGLPREFFHERFAALFHDFQMTYAQRRGKRRWGDKSPRYTLHLPFLDALFPECQVIHVIRDGRDVVSSHRERWGYASAYKATAKWQRYIEAARAAGRNLGPARFAEVRYEALVADPEPELRRLLEFLGEPWDDAVLHHNEVPHDVTASYQSRRAPATGPIERDRVGSHRVRLDPVLRALLRIRSRRAWRALHY
ncbi:MAG: sulfotransferase [Actinobacteria bacterium]|nr:sulfotransferase [Actinomycetota bacterium]